MIEVKNLSKTFNYQGKKIKILDNVSFKIENKDKIAVIGRNGAGKSTFLNIIGGVESPDKGEIKRDCSISWPVGKSAGFVPGLTGRQNATFVLKIFFGNDKNLIREKLAFIQEYPSLYQWPLTLMFSYLMNLWEVEMLTFKKNLQKN